MRDLSLANYFLAIKFVKNSSSFMLSQSKYISSILKKLNKDNYKPISSPCASSSTHHNLASKQNEQINPSKYRSIVGALQYLNITRLEISFAVNRACQSVHSSTAFDWASVKHLLRCLKGSILGGLQCHTK